MTSLLDIGPMTEEVAIGDKSVTVHGVTPEGFFLLLEKYPALQKLMGKGKMEMNELREVAPGSIAYAISLSTTDRNRYPSQIDWLEAVKAAADRAVNLAAHYQIALFQCALRLTFPDGIGPFMQAVTELANSINRVSGKTVPATTSSKRSRSGFSMDSRGLKLGQAAPPENSRH